MAWIAIPPLLKRYWIPILLFALGLFFQLVVLPSSYPPTHYDVLGVKRYASIEEVTKAYEEISNKWHSRVDLPTTIDFIKIRYAFELLTNPVWKRDYDHLGLDEQLHVFQRVKKQYEKEDFSTIKLPLLSESSFSWDDNGFNILTREKFISAIEKGKPLLIQVCSTGSSRCAQFINSWKRISSLLDGVADTGTVEAGDVELVAYLAEKKFTKQPFFRNGLPALVAFPENCRSADCFVRYQGELSVDAIVDWMATAILGLPRILYYSKEALQFTAFCDFRCPTSSERAAIIRLRSYAFQVRENVLLHTSVKLLKIIQAIYHLDWFYGERRILNFGGTCLEWNQPLPLCFSKGLVSNLLFTMASSYVFFILKFKQFRFYKNLGRAQTSSMIWYCVIVAGRPGLELSKLRGAIRRVQDVLLDVVDSDDIGKENPLVKESAAAAAMKQRRLTFVWLDGEVQKERCLFYLAQEYAEGTCGPRNFEDTVEDPKLFVVRFQKQSIEDALKEEKRTNNILHTLRGQDSNLASQLVARYNGSDDIQEIIQWISQIIKDGDTREIPFFTQTVPPLNPEERNQKWSKSVHGMRSAGEGLKERVKNFVSHIGDYGSDPRVGPSLLLCACISFGTIWLQSTRTNQPSAQNESAAASRKDRRQRPRASRSNHDRPESITDAEPKDAYNMLSTNSDSE
ncbi:DnaJ subfamily C member 10 [Ananas comosus]|uniref:DnaJ subfamily C member 10 n=1 Tax=Ananas comosus TaxID=4615 RepID=A0A199UD52_ANACO|nr:DnaJ subfamily C member 10 [Ananas comosus]